MEKHVTTYLCSNCILTFVPHCTKIDFFSFLNYSRMMPNDENFKGIKDGKEEILKAIKVGHNGGILDCVARYRQKCQNP